MRAAAAGGRLVWMLVVVVMATIVVRWTASAGRVPQHSFLEAGAPLPDACTNFYANACYAEENEDNTSSTSHFRTISDHHRDIMEQWLSKTPFYHSCMT